VKASRIVGKTIARVLQSRCPDDRRSGHEVDALVFTDGSVLRFVVCEHQSDEHGVAPIYPGRDVEATLTPL
jgi:hypothetical protein